ncbi:MAG: hypothetical protein KGL39_49855 [Patescibacteria group bacterium]|nr:hypothetical protein [Patescibacteria group bacterium]
MKQTKWELEGGYTFTLDTPESHDEYNRLAGVRPPDANSTGDAATDDAISNTMYRGPYADVRWLLANELQTRFGDEVPRKMKDHPNGKKNADGSIVQVPDESEGRYIAKVAAAKTDATIQSVLDEVMAANLALPVGHDDKITFDPSQRVGKGPKSAGPTKEDFATADALIAQGPKKLRVSLGKIKALTDYEVVLVGDDDPDAANKNRLAVAMGCRAVRKNPLGVLKS